MRDRYPRDPWLRAGAAQQGYELVDDRLHAAVVGGVAEVDADLRAVAARAELKRSSTRAPPGRAPPARRSFARPAQCLEMPAGSAKRLCRRPASSATRWRPRSSTAPRRARSTASSASTGAADASRPAASVRAHPVEERRQRVGRRRRDRPRLRHRTRRCGSPALAVRPARRSAAARAAVGVGEDRSRPGGGGPR